LKEASSTWITGLLNWVMDDETFAIGETIKDKFIQKPTTV
jgi:hypothetical protein